MSEEDWNYGEGVRAPYPYCLNRDDNGGLMPVRIDDGKPWRFTYESYEPPPPPITTREDVGVKVGERGVRSKEVETRGMRSENGTLGSIDDLLQQTKSLHRPKKVPTLTGTRIRIRGPKSFSPEAVLDRMLELLSDNETNFQGYADAIKQDGLGKVKEFMGKCIRDEVRQVCTDAPWSKESLAAIKGDNDTERAGIYMHIIWLKDDPATYWLYVGQSTNVKARLTQHRNPFYRAQNPSLHYHVLDSQATDDVFVNLSEPFEMDIENSDLYLNMLEMWCCLLFQTLPEKALKHWLLSEVECPEYGQHLNIALPLYQFRETDNGLDSRAAFSEFRYSKDKALQDHYWSVVRAWHALRHSNDPVKRAIYCKQRALISQAPRNETVRQDKMQSFLQGRHVQVRQGPSGLTFLLNNRKVTIPSRLECDTKYPVYVQLDLAVGDQRHPQPYAVLARDDDVAKRLGISIKYRDCAGRDRKEPLESKGRWCVHQINSTVDRILNVPNKVIVNTPRRERSHYPRRNDRSYTGDAVDDDDEIKWTKEMEDESDPESE